MEWTEILSTSPNELSSDALEFVKINVTTVDSSALNSEQLRKFVELTCFVIGNLVDNEKKQLKIKELNLPRNELKSDDKNELYYIETIQELNREIAEYVYNKKLSTEAAANTTTTDIDPLAGETKKNLLYKIHVKNKYIKRLLSENDMLKDEIERQNEQILLLNVSLKQTAHKLNKAIGDLMEQKQQNHMTVDDITDLHAKINIVRDQMTRIEMDKQKYKHDVLYLGDEIQKKILQWNDVLKRKYNKNFQSNADGDANDDDGGGDAIEKPIESIKSPTNQNIINVKDEIIIDQYDGNRFEVNVLSQAINKRNIIINEMESLLIDLTTEISQSATVINRIIKNLSQREINFAANLEKLRKHLAKLLDRPNNFIEHETQTISETISTSKHHKTRSKRKNHRISVDK